MWPHIVAEKSFAQHTKEPLDSGGDNPRNMHSRKFPKAVLYIER